MITADTVNLANFFDQSDNLMFEVEEDGEGEDMGADYTALECEEERGCTGIRKISKVSRVSIVFQFLICKNRRRLAKLFRPK